MAEIHDIANERNRRPRLPPGGDGGHDGGMSDLEKRVSAIEVKLAGLDVKTDALTHAARETQVDLKSLIKAVSDVAGKVSQLPSTWTMAGWFITVAMGLAGLVFTIAKAMK